MIIPRASWTTQLIHHIALAGAGAMLFAACSTGAAASAPPAAGSPGSTVGATVAAGAPSVAAVGAPMSAPDGGSQGEPGTATATSGVAMAYPYPGYPGAPGLAPDHTIVVTGFGRATIASDLSDRATGQQTALKAALADAKAQADLVARAAGVAIQGVLSVNVSTSQGYFGPFPLPLVRGEAQTNPSPAAPGGAAPREPTVAPEAELYATVTVAYRID